MIIVTGIGRCGTSLVTKWFQQCGLDVGSDKWFKTYNAGLENKHTLDINARLIRKYVKGEDINLHHAKGDIAELPFDVVKDTQFLCHPKIIETWVEVRDDLKVIWMHRDPAKIVESVYSVPEWNTPVYRTRVDLIEQKEVQFEEEINWHKPYMEVLDVQFPDVLKDPHHLIERVGQWVDLPDDALEIWNNLIDNNPHA